MPFLPAVRRAPRPTKGILSPQFIAATVDASSSLIFASSSGGQGLSVSCHKLVQDLIVFGNSGLTACSIALLTVAKDLACLSQAVRPTRKFKMTSVSQWRLKSSEAASLVQRHLRTAVARTSAWLVRSPENWTIRGDGVVQQQQYHLWVLLCHSLEHHASISKNNYSLSPGIKGTTASNTVLS